MPTNVIMPQMGESVAEGTVTKWFKKLGDRVERDEALFEISTDKVDAEIPSPAAGVLTQILVNENETVAVNTTVAVIDGQEAVPAGQAKVRGATESKVEDVVPATPTAAPQVDSSTPQAVPPATPVLAPGGKTRSSPLVRRMAVEHKLDLSQIEGTGLGGRISKKDVLAHLAQQSQAPAMPPAPTPTVPVVSSTAPPSLATGPAVTQLPAAADLEGGFHRTDAGRTDDSDAQADCRTHDVEPAHLGTRFHRI